MPNQANLSTATGQALVRFEKQLSATSIGTLWLGRLLNGSDAGRVVVLRRIARHWLSLKDAEWVMYGAEAYAKVRHPSLVKLLGVLEQDDDLLSISEHLEGVRLIDLQRSVFDEGVPIPATVAMRLVLDAARATWQAHRLAANIGIFPSERLFLPESVHITSYGSALLTEVGVLSALARCVVPRTVPELLAQLAPEELGARNAQAGSPEVFSLGVVLWELLANRWLFSHESDSRTHQELLLAQIPSLDRVERFGMPVPDALVSLVRKATRRDPAERFASVNDLVLAIEQLPAHFVATEQQVAEVLRQRAGVLLKESRVDESDRALSGTFAELRSTRPSIVPASASSHDWDQPTFAQRSLISHGAPATAVVPPPHSYVAPQRTSLALPLRRKRRLRILSLFLSSVAIAAVALTMHGFSKLPKRRANATPAPAARVTLDRGASAPAPTSAPAVAIRSAPNVNSDSAAADPQFALKPNPSASAMTGTDDAPHSATGSRRVTAPKRGAVTRRVRTSKGTSPAQDGNATTSGVDPQWGI